jgi:hypothetical protein
MTTPAVSRDWATPLLLAAFALMASTGVLMFFHWHTHLQEEIHSWLGWGVVAAAVLHVVGNLTLFKRHFTGRRLALGLLAVAVAVLVGTSLMRPAGGQVPSVPALAIQALSRAPLQALAPVFGLSVADARQALADAGLVLADDNASLDAAAQGSREQIGKGLQALSAASRKAAPR